MEPISYILPTLAVVLLFMLKLFIFRQGPLLEVFKRMAVESSIDFHSLALSFVISNMLSIQFKIQQLQKEGLSTLVRINQNKIQEKLSLYWSYSNERLIILFIYIIILVIIVFISRYFISKYEQKDKLKYIIFGLIIGNFISLISLYYSIILINNIGGI